MNLSPTRFKRRDFCALAAGSLGSLLVANACHIGRSEVVNNGRLAARPQTSLTTAPAGQSKIELDRNHHAILHLPKSGSESPRPLLVMLHGATQNADDMFWYLGTTHEEAGVAVLAPNSRGTTWDGIRGRFSSDVEDLNRALERVFATTAIDPARVAIGGFSDGATYAIALGLINGDLFNSVLAFSPGFIIPHEPQGKPRVFISHGTHDRILPIDQCGRRIAATLKARGYDVMFREFDGDHEIPADIARAGLQWISE